MGQLLNSIANIIGGEDLENYARETTEKFNDMCESFKPSGNKRPVARDKHLYEVIYKDKDGNRCKSIVEASNESECLRELTKSLGRNDIRLVSVRRK